MIYVLGGGGGAGLNFKVVGGTSAPSNPTTNTIWVNTSAKITSWVFHATQPSAVEGKLWIRIGKSSTAPFNAVKENRVTVYPISAKQYVNGAWVDKTAKIYQYGEWADWWNGELYENGNQFFGGDGIVKKGVENTIANVGRLARVGMEQTDKEIIQLMMET